jgi:hypothetical protein
MRSGGREAGIASSSKDSKVGVRGSGGEEGKVDEGDKIALVGSRFRRQVAAWRLSA